MKKKPIVLFIVGPTATGKTKMAIQLAKKYNGEIVSADSMQIYKKMDIGTAKPTKREQKNIPHHLLSIVSPSRTFSVFDYRKRALKVIENLVKKEKLPIVVGGTGLYIRSLLQGLDELPKKNEAFRKKLEAQAKKKGVKSLYTQLKKKSLARARKIKPTDLKRIIRALEICEFQTSRVPIKKSKSLRALGYQPVVIALERERSLLYEAINKRVDRMFRQKLYAEVKKLSKGRISQTARQAVGYKELIEVLEKRSTLGEAKELIKRNSRRLAKRQMTWFRKEKEILWFDLDQPKQSLEALLKPLLP